MDEEKMFEIKQQYDLKKLELEQQYEIRRMELTVEFAKFGFYGTLISALSGMGVLIILAGLIAWKDIQNGVWMIIAFSVALTVCLIAFGYFSLFKLPEIGVEWGKVKTRIGHKAESHPPAT